MLVKDTQKKICLRAVIAGDPTYYDAEFTLTQNPINCINGLTPKTQLTEFDY